MVSQKSACLAKSLSLYLTLILFPFVSLQAAEEKGNPRMGDPLVGNPLVGNQAFDPGDLRQSYHRLETAYAFSRVRSVKTSEKTALQNFLISGDIVLTPQVSLTTRLPFISLGKELALTNPSLGIVGALFEGLLKGFPSFVFLHADMKPPLSSDQEFVFNRTDISIGISSLREVYHLSLRSALFYTLKLDSDASSDNYGNELSASLGGELNTGYQFSVGAFLDYHRSAALQTPSVKIPGRSLFILRPHFSYHYGTDMTFDGSFAIPIGRHKLQEALRVFGDYTIAGIGGNTFYLSFEKKF